MQVLADPVAIDHRSPVLLRDANEVIDRPQVESSSRFNLVERALQPSNVRISRDAEVDRKRGRCFGMSKPDLSSAMLHRRETRGQFVNCHRLSVNLGTLGMNRLHLGRGQRLSDL